jgi:hypothetical protein
MKITFADEPTRVKAIEELGDNPANLDKLKEVMEAPIGPPEPVVEETPKETSKEVIADVPKETPKQPETPVVPKTFTLTDKDLPQGFDSPGKVFKSYSEAQDLVTRQAEKIKELLGKQDRPAVEQTALERAEKAEKELAQLKGGKPKQETSVDIAATNAEIQRIDTLQDELEELAKDPDAAYTADYQKKARELSKLQTKNLNVLTGLLTKAQQEIMETRKNTTEFGEFIQGQKQTIEQEKRTAKLETAYKEVDSIGAIEADFKLTKSSKEVEQDYVNWRDGVALAVYGRPAKTRAEKNAALDQLKVKTPELISKLRIMGISEEPTEDIKRFITVCEVLDYQDAHNIGTLKDAIKHKRLEDGYYDKQFDGSFQKGAQSVAEAAQRRDKGAVELNAHEDVGQTQDSQAWAQRILENADSEAAKKEYDHGNTARFDEINKARKVFGLEPITFSE